MGIAVAHIGFWWSLIPGFLGLYGGLIGGFIGEFLIARAKYFWTPTRLLLNGTLTPEIAAWLWMLMENSFPILICGEMDSGRTSLINALCFFVKPDSRVGTVEDDSEFKLPLRHKNWLRLSTRDSLNVGGQPISQDKILEQMLRQSVEYIVVNEVKGKGDLSTWINAVSLGHGGVTSFHASSFDDLTLRLQQLGIEKDSLLTISGGIIFVARFKERKSMVVRIRALIQVVNKNGDITGEPLVNYDAQNCSYAIDTNRLLSSMPAKKISESTGKDARELFENKVNYLKWLFGYAKTKRNVLEPDGFFSEISRYYEDPDYYKRFIKKP
jgi:flagellar protein FlaI